jgi:hypothetical protein
VHECPASLALYVRQRGHRPVDLTHKVHIDHAPELIGFCLVERSEEVCGREVYPGVEPTVLLDSALGDGLYLLELGDISRPMPLEAPITTTTWFSIGLRFTSVLS